MKYVLHHASPAIVWPGFHIETKTGDGAAKLAEELNRLDKDMNDWAVECHKAQAERDGLRKGLNVQIEANQSNLKKLTELINIQKSQGRDRYMTGMLNGLILARSVLDGENQIYEDHQGGVELNEKQTAHIVSTLDRLAAGWTCVWPQPMREAYEKACRLLGVSDDGDVQPTPSKVNAEFEVVMLMSSPAQYRVVGPDTNLDFGTWKNTAQEVCARLNAQLAEREAREFKLFESNCEKKSFEERLAVRDQQARQLLDALEASQGVLRLYIEPGSRMKPKVVLTDLLGILDGAVLVTMMRNLRAWLGKNPDIYACDDTAGEASVEFLKTDFPTRRYTSGIGLGLNGDVEISTATVSEASITGLKMEGESVPMAGLVMDLSSGVHIDVQTNGTCVEVFNTSQEEDGVRLDLYITR